MAPRPRVRTPARGVRADGARRGLRRRRRADDRTVEGRRVGRRRLEDLHHERRHRHHGLATIIAVKGENEISTGSSRTVTPGYMISPPMQKLGWRGFEIRELPFQGAAGARGEPARPARGRSSSSSSDPRRGRISVAVMGVGLAQGCDHLARRTRRSASSSAADPVVPGGAAEVVDIVTELEAARLTRRRPRGRGIRAASSRDGRDGEALLRRAVTARRTGRCRSTAATASWTSTRSRGSTATRRSSRSAKARTRCSAW